MPLKMLFYRDLAPVCCPEEKGFTLIRVTTYLLFLLGSVLVASNFNLATAQATSINSTNVRFTPVNPTANENVIDCDSVQAGNYQLRILHNG